MIAVYQWQSIGGRPVAIRDGNVVFDGTGNAPLVCIEGNHIYRGRYSNRAPDFTVNGNRVHYMLSGAIVFTIQGNDICDGMGGPPFLTCPSGDDMALAGAAVAFMGDMRLRCAGANVVDADSYELTDRDDGGVDHSYYGSYPDPYSDKRAPSELTNKYGDPGYSNDSFKNLRQQGRAPRSSNRRFDSKDGFESKNGEVFEQGIYDHRSYAEKTGIWCPASPDLGVEGRRDQAASKMQRIFPGCAIMFAIAIFCYKHFEELGFGFMYKLFLLYCLIHLIVMIYNIGRYEIKWYQNRRRK